MVDSGFVSLVGVPDTIHRLLRRVLNGEAPDAANLAEEFSDQVLVPVWRAYALPVINTALIAVGRITEAQAITDRVGSLVAEMDTAPQLTASIHAGRAQVALARDELGEAEQEALASLQVRPRRPPPHRHRRRARPAGRRQRATRTGLSVVDREGGQSRAAAPRLPLLHRSDPRRGRPRRGRWSPRCFGGDHRAHRSSTVGVSASVPLRAAWPRGRARSIPARTVCSSRRRRSSRGSRHRC